MKLKTLKKGDTIGVVAPSFWLEKKENAERAFDRIRKLGFKLKFGPEIFKKYWYTTNTPQKRAESINKMFVDKKVNAIVCLDGGCGSIELLGYLDYDKISKNPKVFSGFSDVTYINLALLTKSRITPIYGFDIINGFGNFSFSESYNNNESFFLKEICSSKKIGNLPFDASWETWRNGNATGMLVGGWLEALTNLSATEYFPKNNKLILFWETVDCEPNKINTLLNVLKISGILKKTKAMLIGKLKNCEEKEYFDCYPRIKDLILNLTKDENFPIIANIDFGHGKDMLSIPLGLKARVSASNKSTKVEIMGSVT